MRLRHVQHSAIAGILAVLSFLTPLSARAGGVVDSAEIRIADQYADIEIKFNVPIDIGTYAPRAHGALLQIDIELPVDAEFGNAPRLGATEWIAGSQPSAFTLYEYLRFDRAREPNRGRLVIKFLRDVDFTVYKSSDSHAIVVSVLKADVPKVRTEKLAGQSQLLPETARAVQSSAAAATKRAAQSRREEQEIAMTALAAAPVAGIETKIATQAAATTTNTEPDGSRAFTALSNYSAPAPLSAPVPASTPAPTVKLASQGEITGETAAAKPARSASKNDGWRVYGGFSQSYNYSDVKISRSGDPRFNSSETRTSQNNLRSYLNLSARYRDDDWDVRSRFNGGYRLDFLDHSQDTFKSRSAGNKALLSDAYIDVRHRHSDISAKVGRQYGSSGGVFGRFDGAQVGVPLGAGWRANMVAGSPVDLTSNKTVDDTNTYFYGANFDFAPQNKRWQTNVYMLEQMIDGSVGRRALGNETRYYAEGRSLLTLLDYDIEYRVLNRALAIGTWTPFKPTTLNATLDYGYSPLLTTRNALIAQPDYSSIKQMRTVYSDAEIEQLARDRTAEYRNVLIGVTQQLDELTQLYAGIGQYYYGALPASGGVEAMSATGDEYDYTLQYIRTGLLQENDTHAFGLRYYGGNSVQRSAAGIDARYSWGSWRVSPRLWIERRNNLRDDSSEWVYRPGLRVEYSFLRRYHIELDASSDVYQGEIPEVGNQDIVGNFVQLGYRIDID